MLLTIIIPAYNEEKRISKTLKTYTEFLDRKMPNQYGIIVVPNGCKDNTLGVVRKYPHKSIKCVNINEAVGKGGAIIKGFSIANSKYLAFVDADNSIDVIQFYKMFKSIINTNTDMVIASRNLKNSLVVAKNLQRKILSFGYNKLVNFLFEVDLKDTQCGAKILNIETYNKIKNKLTITDMAFDINLIYEVKKVKKSILEVPILWVDQDGGAVRNPLLVGFKMLITTLKYRIGKQI